MKEIKNLWDEVIETCLELSDIVVGKTYKVNGHAKPMYLRGDKVTVVSLGRKNAVVKDNAYPDELFSLPPHMLTEI